jgi:hypothetical protein
MGAALTSPQPVREVKMETKQCVKCKKIKPITCFNKNRSRDDGLSHYCKDCHNEACRKYVKKNHEKVKKYRDTHKEEAKQRAKKWYYNNYKKALKCREEYRAKNAEKLKSYQRNWYVKNAEKIKEERRKRYAENPELANEQIKEYRRNNPDKVKETYRKVSLRRSKDPVYKLSHAISKGIYKSMRRNKNGNHWEDLVGYTLDDLIKHLESQFKDGMSWDNYGSGWHIDHKTPKSWFHFTSYEDKEFKQCWALDNLQPLWAEENIRKQNRYAS